jgi:AcrR family transcriptional regulator
VSQEETRRRIVEATVQLHEELGARDTTISAIAEKAQVQRLTVYRHFADETELFKACTSHWFALNPPPDLSMWSEMDGIPRLHSSLLHLYSYYRRTERMWSLSYRDEPDVPALKQPMERVRKYLASIQRDITEHISFDPVLRDRVEITIGCALQFSTWQSLARYQDSDDAIARLVCDWLNGVLVGQR